MFATIPGTIPFVQINDESWFCLAFALTLLGVILLFLVRHIRLSRVDMVVDIANWETAEEENPTLERDLSVALAEAGAFIVSAQSVNGTVRFYLELTGVEDQITVLQVFHRLGLKAQVVSQSPRRPVSAKTTILIILAGLIGLASTLPRRVEAAAPPHILINGYRVNIRWDRPHRFGWCVNQPVKHLNVDVFFMQNGRGIKRALFHAGWYKHPGTGKTCWVVWESELTGQCTDSCRNGGTRWQVARDAVVVVAKIAGLVLAVTVVVGLTRVLAGAMAGA